MKNPAYIIRYATLAILLGCRASAQSTQISFVSLQANETILVQFESQGCFHHTKYLLRFEPNFPGGIRLSTFDQNGAKLAPISLSPSDLKSLDLLLSIYRNIRKGACTTVDTITVTKHRSGVVVAQERYVDATCDLGSRIEMANFSTYRERAGGK